MIPSAEPASPRPRRIRRARAFLMAFAVLFGANLAAGSGAHATPILWTIGISGTAEGPDSFCRFVPCEPIPGGVNWGLGGSFTNENVPGGNARGVSEFFLGFRSFVSGGGGSSSLSFEGDDFNINLHFHTFDGVISDFGGGSACFFNGGPGCFTLTSAMGTVREVIVPEPSSFALLGGGLLLLWFGFRRKERAWPQSACHKSR
jgi:hypothetical protein